MRKNKKYIAMFLAFLSVVAISASAQVITKDTATGDYVPVDEKDAKTKILEPSLKGGTLITEDQLKKLLELGFINKEQYMAALKNPPYVGPAFLEQLLADKANDVAAIENNLKQMLEKGVITQEAYDHTLKLVRNIPPHKKVYSQKVGTDNRLMYVECFGEDDNGLYDGGSGWIDEGQCEYGYGGVYACEGMTCISYPGEL